MTDASSSVAAVCSCHRIPIRNHPGSSGPAGQQDVGGDRVPAGRRPSPEPAPRRRRQRPIGHDPGAHRLLAPMSWSPDLLRSARGALGAVMKVKDVGVRLLTASGDPLNVTVVSEPKSSPVTVTFCPPTTGPIAGLTAVMAGADTVSCEISVFQQAWIVVQAPSMTPSAAPETTHTSLVFEGSCAMPE